MKKLWAVLTAALLLVLVSAAPAHSHGPREEHRRFGGEQVMALNIDLETNAILYGCEDISWFGTIELYGRTYGMALYAISSTVGDDGVLHYEEGWRIFTGKFRVKDGEIKRCAPGRILAEGTDVGVWDISTGEFESTGTVDFARGRLRRWSGRTVTQDGIAPQPVSVARLTGRSRPGWRAAARLTPSVPRGRHLGELRCNSFAERSI